jgi:uncharacterized protein (DUF1810 family)
MEDAGLFLEAQDAVMENVRSELRAGRKLTHWMWFIFPQLAALGRSDYSQLYGLHDLQEASDYLADPDLCARLVEVAGLILHHAGTPAEAILGKVDARKLQSSMTLFAAVKDAPPVFEQVLAAFFDGARCRATLDHLAS